MSNIIETPIAFIRREHQFIFVELKSDLKHLMTIRNVVLHFDALKSLCYGEKLAFVFDVSNIKPMLVDRLIRAEISRHFYKYASVCVFCSNDIKVSFFINLFFKLTPTKVPMKIFGNRKEAISWANNEHNKSSMIFGF